MLLGSLLEAAKGLLGSLLILAEEGSTLTCSTRSTWPQTRSLSTCTEGGARSASTFAPAKQTPTASIPLEAFPVVNHEQEAPNCRSYALEPALSKRRNSQHPIDKHGFQLHQEPAHLKRQEPAMLIASKLTTVIMTLVGLTPVTGIYQRHMLEEG